MFRLMLECFLEDKKFIESKKEIERKQIIKNSKIVVTMTSWRNRIFLVNDVIRIMLNQTLVPTKIVLNLSEDEFKHKEKDLPKDLVSTIERNSNICEIYWVKENYKQFKKLVHTLDRYPNDIVISIDDDFPYPRNFVETLFNDYIDNNRENPISYSNYVDKDGFHTHHGSFTITESKFYEDYLHEILEKFVYPNFNNYKCYDDPVYTEAARLNGYDYKEGSVNYNKFRLNLHSETVDALSKRTKTYSEKRNKFISDLKEFCDKIKPINPRVAVCAIAKNENLYIREWVEWYKNLGIEKIFLYDNNDIDGERFEEVINDYIESGFVEVIDRRGIEKGCVYDEKGINLQPKCYIEFYEGEGKNYDWICFFDVDEFLVFKNNYTLFSFLNQDKFKDEDLILISWQHYDDNNLLYYDSRPVMERFTHESKLYRHAVKSIVRTNKEILNKHQNNLIHIFRLVDDKTIHSSGLKLIDKKTWYVIPHGIHISSPCWLNHYKTKTAQEYIKRHLGRHWGTGKNYTCHAKDIIDCIDDFFRYNEKSKEKLNIFKKYSFDKNYVKEELINYGNKINIKINLDNPKTFQDKINWLKVYDSTELKSKCADKILVHEYSKEKLGKDICIPIIKEYNNIYEFTLDWKNIPDNCVIKCNHGSGYMIVCKEKSKLNKDDCIKKLNTWLHINYGLDHWGYQLHYAKIKPKIFTEVLMKNDNSNKLLINYKFLCFNGVPKIIEIYQSDGPENDTREQMNFYDLDFNLLNISQWHHDNNPFRKDKKPINYDKMIEYAKLLSADFKFVRVDFYEINNQIYLGELTFTPNNGFVKFNNDKKYHTSEYLGNLLSL